MDKVSWPAWYYGPKGEAEIFQKAEDVPKGWQDHPNKFEKRSKAGDGEKGGKGAKDGEKGEGNDDPNDTGVLTREQIVADLKRRKVFFKANDTTAKLYRILSEAIEKEA